MKMLSKLLIASAISGLVATSGLANDDLVKKGEKVFTSKNLGNCVACHAITGSSKVMDMGPGSFGPDLSTAAYYDKELLGSMIYDIYSAKGLTNTAMPAYGKGGLLDKSEINALVAFIQSFAK
jgi:sulfur-oxidizing protein SoxX